MKILPHLSIYFCPSFALRGSSVLPVHDKNADFFLFFSLPLSLFFFLLSLREKRGKATIPSARHRYNAKQMAGRERGRLFLHRRFCGLCSRFFSRPGKRICFIHAYIITFANRFRFLSNYFAKDDFEDSKKNCWVKIFATRIKKKKKRKEHRKNHKIINIFLLSYSWNFQFNFVIIFIYICPSFISFIFSRFPSLKKKKKEERIFSDIWNIFILQMDKQCRRCASSLHDVSRHIYRSSWWSTYILLFRNNCNSG